MSGGRARRGLLRRSMDRGQVQGPCTPPQPPLQLQGAPLLAFDWSRRQTALGRLPSGLQQRSGSAGIREGAAGPLGLPSRRSMQFPHGAWCCGAPEALPAPARRLRAYPAEPARSPQRQRQGGARSREPSSPRGRTLALSGVWQTCTAARRCREGRRARGLAPLRASCPPAGPGALCPSAPVGAHHTPPGSPLAGLVGPPPWPCARSDP